MSNIDEDNIWYGKYSDKDSLKRILIKKKMESSSIDKGDTVVLKSKYRNYYKKEYNATTVDISKPVKVIKCLRSSGKIYLEGWEEIHNKKGGPVPSTSFDKYSERKAKIFSFYKPEPLITKCVAQIQEVSEKTLTAVCIKNQEILTEEFPIDLFYEIVDTEKGKFFTITSTMIPGKQVFDYTPSTEEEIRQWNEVHKG